MLATTTVTARRQIASPAAGQDGMVDPWDSTDTDAAEPGAVVEWSFPAAIVGPGVQSRWGGGVREQQEWRLLAGARVDVRLGDEVTDDATGLTFRVQAVHVRQVPEGMTIGHVAVDLIRVVGEASA